MHSSTLLAPILSQENATLETIAERVLWLATNITAVSDTELLAMILQGNGTRTEEAVKLASHFR